MNRMAPSNRRTDGSVPLLLPLFTHVLFCVFFSMLLLSLLSVPALAQDEPLEEAVSVRREGNEKGVESQKRIDAVSADTENLFTRYQNALAQIDSIRVYNTQMRRLIAFQEGEITSLRDQVDRVDVVGRSVTPLMLRMIAAIDQTVKLDIPFLAKEREERINDLHALMGRADVSNAEKYRQIMEAYQTENEYGRTIEAYRSTLILGGTEVKVDLLRFGRIALVYQTLDGREAGVWNQVSRQWEGLDSSYQTALKEGLKIARKQQAPDLIRIPLPAAVRSGGNS